MKNRYKLSTVHQDVLQAFLSLLISHSDSLGLRNVSVVCS